MTSLGEDEMNLKRQDLTMIVNAVGTSLHPTLTGANI